MEQVIAECAERIVRLLDGMDEVNLLRLSELLPERNVLTYQAVGWLAREGRISYVQRGNQTYVTVHHPHAPPAPGSTTGRSQ